MPTVEPGLPMAAQPTRKELRLVITASSLGALFEWYDFYVYGTLAVLFGKLFFPAASPATAFLLALATFGVGFVVRPIGAVVFGMLSVIVCLGTASVVGEAAWEAWGWRIPFLFSLLLLAESPVFKAMKAASEVSRQPLKARAAVLRAGDAGERALRLNPYGSRSASSPSIA